MASRSQFGTANSRKGFNLDQVHRELKAEERRRSKEFSKVIGERALRLGSALGIQRREYHFEEGDCGGFVPDGYNVGMTTYSNTGQFEDGSFARVRVTRDRSSAFMISGSARLLAARAMPKMAGPIVRIGIDYGESAHGSIRKSDLTQGRYSRIIFSAAGATPTVDKLAQKDIADFLERLEWAEAKVL